MYPDATWRGLLFFGQALAVYLVIRKNVMHKMNNTATTFLQVLSMVLIAATAAGEESGNSGTDKVSFSGDLRLRWEGIYQDEREDRERGRFRARFGFDADVAEDIKLIMRFATGAGNPASTNQTIGDGFSGKDITIDRAYVDWKINDNLKLFGGKMKNPFLRVGGNSLVWDSDVNPEGVVVALQSGVFFGNLGWLVVDEDSTDDDVFVYSAQAGLKFNLGDTGTLTTGFSYFDYTDVAGKVPFFKGRAKGNSVDVDGNYLFDFSIVEWFVEYKTRFRDLPLTVFGEWTRNTEVDLEDTAYAFGIKLGSTKEQGNTQFSYAYHDTDADALIGTFTDSDFAGGNTDSRGHFIKARFALRDHVVLGGTLIIARLAEFSGNERDYDRIMIDIEFSF